MSKRTGIICWTRGYNGFCFSPHVHSIRQPSDRQH